MLTIIFVLRYFGSCSYMNKTDEEVVLLEFYVDIRSV
jgi:hypothetical protein